MASFAVTNDNVPCVSIRNVCKKMNSLRLLNIYTSDTFTSRSATDVLMSQ